MPLGGVSRGRAPCHIGRGSRQPPRAFQQEVPARRRSGGGRRRGRRGRCRAGTGRSARDRGCLPECLDAPRWRRTKRVSGRRSPRAGGSPDQGGAGRGQRRPDHRLLLGCGSVRVLSPWPTLDRAISEHRDRPRSRTPGRGVAAGAGEGAGCKTAAAWSLEPDRATPLGLSPCRRSSVSGKFSRYGGSATAAPGWSAATTRLSHPRPGPRHPRGAGGVERRPPGARPRCRGAR